MRGLGRITAALGAAIAGAGAAIFLHPRSGGRNRHAAAGVARRRSANVATIVGRAPRRGPGELRIADAVHAPLVAGHPGVTDGLQVTAHKGTVTLRGEVARLDDIDALEATARSVAGVADVNNLLRLATTATAGR